MANLKWDRSGTSATTELGQYQVHEWDKVWLELTSSGCIGFFKNKELARSAAQTHFDTHDAAAGGR